MPCNLSRPTGTPACYAYQLSSNHIFGFRSWKHENTCASYKDAGSMQSYFATSLTSVETCTAYSPYPAGDYTGKQMVSICPSLFCQPASQDSCHALVYSCGPYTIPHVNARSWWPCTLAFTQMHARWAQAHAYVCAPHCSIRNGADSTDSDVFPSVQRYIWKNWPASRSMTSHTFLWSKQVWYMADRFMHDEKPLQCLV